MSLTAEEIAKWQEALSKLQSEQGQVLPPGSNVLCHMALASLTEREKGYKAGLEAAAKIAIKHPSSSGFDIAKKIQARNWR